MFKTSIKLCLNIGNYFEINNFQEEVTHLTFAILVKEMFIIFSRAFLVRFDFLINSQQKIASMEAFETICSMCIL